MARLKSTILLKKNIYCCECQLLSVCLLFLVRYFFATNRRYCSDAFFSVMHFLSEAVPLGHLGLHERHCTSCTSLFTNTRLLLNSSDKTSTELADAYHATKGGEGVCLSCPSSMFLRSEVVFLGRRAREGTP